MIERRDSDGIRTLLMDRPPANALSSDLLGALSREFGRAGEAAGVRAVVLGSKSPKYFSPGLDLVEMFKDPAGADRGLFAALIRFHRELLSFPKPAVAAIEGSALLGGWIVALGCDFRVMAEGPGRITLSEVKLGLTPTEALIRRMGMLSKDPAALREMVLKGKALRAEAALAAGFVERVAAPGTALDEADREARSLAKSPPKSYAAVKRALLSAAGLEADDVWDRSMRDFRELFAGPEARECLAAAKEKRKPRIGV